MPVSDVDTQQLLRDLARETLERYREINLLYRASETLGASLDAQEVPRLLLDEAQRVMPSDNAIVLVGDAAADEGWTSALSLIESVRVTGRPDYTDSALCVPIRAGDRALGVVVLRRDGGRSSFNAGDEKLLLGLASQAGVALERARLHEHETRRIQLEQELDVARRIQMTLLPAAPPDIHGWGFAATYRAARQVGGDFYDFMCHALPNRRLGLAIADVTGKGVPAALMMAYSRAVLRAESMAGRSPADVLTNTNRLIMQERQSRLFLSALYAEIELDDGRFTFASAGHDSPLWIKGADAEVIELDAPGVLLGAFHETGIESRTVVLDPGDFVMLYTDGVTEARNDARDLFGDDRLKAVATTAANGGTAQSMLESVLSAVAEFCGDAEQADDLTMVVVQRERVR